MSDLATLSCLVALLTTEVPVAPWCPLDDLQIQTMRLEEGADNRAPAQNERDLFEKYIAAQERALDIWRWVMPIGFGFMTAAVIMTAIAAYIGAKKTAKETATEVAKGSIKDFARDYDPRLNSVIDLVKPMPERTANQAVEASDEKMLSLEKTAQEQKRSYHPLLKAARRLPPRTSVVRHTLIEHYAALSSHA